VLAGTAVLAALSCVRAAGSPTRRSCW